MIWRINREAVITLAGTAAILMQFAHPKVVAGVRDHSRFEADPAGRLRRTMDLTLALVFGPRPTAMGAARAINQRHRVVQGPAYSATDPELLMWVQATLVYSALTAYRMFVGPLTAGEQDRFYQDTKEIGVLLGIARGRYPAELDGFNAYLRAMIDGGPILVGEEARRLGSVALRPGFFGLPKQAFAPLTLITAGLLPPRLREGYGLRWGRAQRTAFGASRFLLRRLVAIAPPPLRLLPPARDADRRLRRAQMSAQPSRHSALDG
jgi:uncharacterized protein (DUF2236 family)